MLEITASIPKRLSNNRHVVQKRKYHTNAKKALESTKQESQESFHYKSRVKGGERESSKDKLRSCKIAEYARPLSLSFSLFLSLFFFFLPLSPLFSLFLPFSLSFSLFLPLSIHFSQFLYIYPYFSLFFLSPSFSLFISFSTSFSLFLLQIPFFLLHVCAFSKLARLCYFHTTTYPNVVFLKSS